MSRNLEEIARLAGVSRSTASRVINNHPNVSEETRNRVMTVIREQNFRPNLAARALVTQQTRVISLVIPQAIGSTFTDPYFPTLIQGIMARANELDYAVMLWIGNLEEEDRFRERIVHNTFFDGLLIASAIKDDPLIRDLSRMNFPFVIVGPAPFANLNYIDVDNCRGADDAVMHLVRCGYKRIGTITGPMNMNAAVDRLSGYRDVMDRARLPIDESLIVEGRFDEGSGYAAMKTLLARGVDAVFAASDMMAVGALRAIDEAGLRVPKDIAVVGFDDLPLAASLRVPLTTVHQPIQEVGSMATQMLVDLLNGTAETPYQKILPATLVIRETSGAARL
jgi:LacI family transcriptional regulator